MALPTSGPISFSAINQELGFASNAPISIGGSITRTLAKIATGQIRLDNFYNRIAAPIWSTASGSLGSNYTQRASTFAPFATSNFAVEYSLASGSIPTGMSLNTSNGFISGTPTGIADYSSSTFNFTITAKSSGTNATSSRSFSITIASRYVGYRCSTTSEPNGLGDTAPSGMVFNRVDFSSYGTPNGSCGAFTIGGCNAGSSNGYNPTPTTSYSTSASNGVWGDPCPGVPKRMYIQMSYGPF